MKTNILSILIFFLATTITYGQKDTIPKPSENTVKALNDLLNTNDDAPQKDGVAGNKGKSNSYDGGGGSGSGSGYGASNSFSNIKALKSTTKRFFRYDGRDRGFEVTPEKEIKSDTVAKCNKPKNLADLDGGYNMFYSEGKTVKDASGNIIYMTAKTESEITQLNYKFLQFKREQCTNSKGESKEFTWGAGVELKLYIKSKKKSIGLNSLSNIAAAVNYKEAEVTYKIDVIGITGDAIRRSMNLNGEFNVENYALIKSGIDKIIDNMSEDGVKINPQLVFIE